MIRLLALNRNIIIVFLSCHLLIIGAGVVPPSIFPRKFVSYFLGPYARLTGAGASYGFFSPNVGNQLRVSFLATLNSGQVTEVKLEDTVSKEAAVRVGNMFRLLAQVFENKQLRRSTLASLSTHIFNSKPDVVRVQAIVHLYEVPSLWQIPLGHKIVSRPVYEVTFMK